MPSQSHADKTCSKTLNKEDSQLKFRRRLVRDNSVVKFLLEGPSVHSFSYFKLTTAAGRLTRNDVAKEIVDTERTYVSSLSVLVQVCLSRAVVHIRMTVQTHHIFVSGICHSCRGAAPCSQPLPEIHVQKLKSHSAFASKSAESGSLVAFYLVYFQ